MNDDWRLQIDLDDAGIGGQISDHLRAAELEHDLETAFDRRVIVSHEGERIYLYAGDRGQLDRARVVVQGQLDQKGWDAKFDLRHWHEIAEDWEDPDAAEPTTAAAKEAEHERLMKTEDEETAARGGLAEFEVRVEFPAHREAKRFAEKLKEEGLEPVRRWRYMVVGAADEDAANDVADVPFSELKVDGGMTADELLMQFQADVLGVPVIRPAVTETTALGAAFAAGLATDFWSGTDELRERWEEDKRWEPSMDEEERERRYGQWKKAVERTFDWVE
jgi:hypothetical protein